MQPDLIYYRQRFVEELSAARRAMCSQAAARHRELAALYLKRWQNLSRKDLRKAA